MPDSREEWLQQAKSADARLRERRRTRRRRIILGDFAWGEFARTTIASVVGTLLGAILIVLGGALFGAITDLGWLAIGSMIAVAGALIISLVVALVVDESQSPEKVEFYELVHEGIEKGWIG